MCCNKLLFSCITNHLHFKAISLILSICQKLQTHQNIQNSCESSGKNKSKPFPINKSANDKSFQPYKNKCNEKIPKSTFSLTLLTPLGYVMVSDLPDRLSYSEIISVITRYTEIPTKLLNLVVGNRKLMTNDILDLKAENFINVYVKGFGGGKDSSANSDTNEKHNCKKCSICFGESLRFFHMTSWSDEKVAIAQSLSSKPLNKIESCICHKCEHNICKKLSNPSYQPKKKRRQIFENCLLKKEGLCDAEAYCTTTLGNAELFSQCFGIGVENLPPNQNAFPVCNKHKMKYWFLQSNCALSVTSE